MNHFIHAGNCQIRKNGIVSIRTINLKYDTPPDPFTNIRIYPGQHLNLRPACTDLLVNLCVSAGVPLIGLNVGSEKLPHIVWVNANYISMIQPTSEVSVANPYMSVWIADKDAEPLLVLAADPMSIANRINQVLAEQAPLSASA